MYASMVVDGLVIEALPRTLFRVVLESRTKITAYLSKSLVEVLCGYYEEIG